MNTKLLLATLAAALASGAATAQRVWTLGECLDYARDNNLQLMQSRLTAQSGWEDVRQSRAALFPSVSLSTNQNASWRPFAESTITLTNGSMTTNRNTVSYNGSYGINANWTVWNGNRNRNTIKQNRLAAQAAALDTERAQNSILEQVAALYVQILYEEEAARVCAEIIKASELQAERARVMVEAGSLAHADLSQLRAQVSQDQYNLAQAEAQLANYRLQLKQLLEIHDDDTMRVAAPDRTDNLIAEPLPDKAQVYRAALGCRPEIHAAELDVARARVSLASARAGYMPTVSLTAGIGASNSSGQDMAFARQVKKNLSNSIGLSLSMPLFDQFQTRTNIRKAKNALTGSELSLQDTKKQLYSTIEDYSLAAATSRQQYTYAQNNLESMRESYELVSEQFKLGLKNIVELTTGKNNLMQAEQQMLQTKYTALLNAALLKFYAGEELKL